VFYVRDLSPSFFVSLTIAHTQFQMHASTDVCVYPRVCSCFLYLCLFLCLCLSLCRVRALGLPLPLPLSVCVPLALMQCCISSCVSSHIDIDRGNLNAYIFVSRALWNALAACVRCHNAVCVCVCVCACVRACVEQARAETPLPRHD